jgi:hypothetical protein
MKIGERYGRLTILGKGSPAASGQQSRSTMKCECDCGVIKDIRADSLQRGLSRSCGCLHSDVHKTHGHHTGGRASPTYKTWESMIRRVDGKYKKLGISCVHRWRSFENFLADMGERPHGKTLDRIDNSGDYKLENCRWATPKQQARNRRDNVFVTHNGEKRLLIDVCEELKKPYSYTVRRLKINRPPKWMEKECVFVY